MDEWQHIFCPSCAQIRPLVVDEVEPDISSGDFDGTPAPTPIRGRA